VDDPSSFQCSFQEKMGFVETKAPKVRTIGTNPCSIDNECSGEPPVWIGSSNLPANESAGN